MIRRITDNDYEITAAEIGQAIEQMAARIRETYPSPGGCTICGVITGGKTVVEMLKGHFDHGTTYDYPVCFIGAQSYEYGDIRSENVALYGPLPATSLLFERNVVVVDDIVESGNTLKAVVEFLSQRRPNSISAMALCAKGDSVPEVLGSEDNVGFLIPSSKFVVGFGMDYNGWYRDLDSIRPVTEEEKKNAKNPNPGDKKPHDKLKTEIPRPGRYARTFALGTNPVTSHGVKVKPEHLGVKSHQHTDKKDK